jgi:predicted AlkP superfamily phosphohydrolase/phosphomutase
MTDCAWTSAFTGRNPGAHGIFGSWYRAPGDYACRYFSSRDRLAEPVWEIAADARWLVWNVPMTYPPTAVNGAMVAGYGAPPGSRLSNPPELQAQLDDRYGLGDLLDRAPHGSLERFLDELLAGLEAQEKALPWAIGATGADCVAAVWPHIDRAQHFFWRFRGSAHPLADAVERVYEAMDRATGAIVEAFPDAEVFVVSDHGAGPLAADVNLGSWLARNGHAVYGSARASPLASIAWALPPPVRRAGRRLAPRMARAAMGARLTGQLGPFEWARTNAFVGFHGDLWLNLEGREPQGTVAPDDARELLDEIGRGVLSIEDPATGERAFAAAHPREAIYSGEAAHMGPDLMLDSWSQGYRVAPSREATDQVVVPPTPLAGVKEPWSSDHRPLGIFAASGPRIARGSADELSLLDICPTMLALLDEPVPDDLDGTVARDALSPRWLSAHPVRGGRSARRAASATARPSGDLPPEEADAVASHLKDLGYIE